MALTTRIADNSGRTRKKSDPAKIPMGSSMRENPTPQIPTIRRVRKSWMESDSRLKVENQNPKNADNSSGSGMAAAAKSLNR